MATLLGEVGRHGHTQDGDESRMAADSLSAARGVATGTALGVILWALLLLPLIG